ncbi:hypothetical protein [Motiliproteus sp. SC1-56]|uniref:hypothetical protein n=1 Tax=Motiliproteus sp. SC1-56 TaxID=2799565 RepID=UPI001A900F4D|nr:hypothetical protein [Motiliproteus sp. SC1-56]
MQKIMKAAVATVFVGVSLNAAAGSITGGDVYYSTGHYLEGEVIPKGYDIFGYNYQAHRFSGSYYNAYAGRKGHACPPYEGDDEAHLSVCPQAETHWAWPYRNIDISMKWNDAWLSNKDADWDGQLDRHSGLPSYIGSGAWEIYSENYIDENGKMTFSQTKIVAAPEGAYKDENKVWFDANGQELGPDIWGQFIIVQETSSRGGVPFISPNGAGLGKY